MTITRAELAETIGINIRTLHRLQARGMPTSSVAAAKAWRKANVQPPPAKSTLGDDRLRFLAGRNRRIVARLRREGEQVVPTAVALDVWNALAAAPKAHVMKLARRLAEPLAAERDPSACEHLFRTALYEAFERLSSGEAADAAMAGVPDDGGLGALIPMSAADAKPADGLLAERARGLRLKTAIDGLRSAREEGRVVARAALLHAVSASIMSIKKRVFGLPTRLAPRFARAQTAKEVERMLREELEQVFGELPSAEDTMERLQRATAAPPPPPLR